MKKTCKILMATFLLSGVLFSCGNNTGKDKNVFFSMGIKYKLNDDKTASVCGYDKNKKVSDITIENKLKVKKYNKTTEYLVTDIEEYAFAGCDSLETVNMVDGINNIGDHAFYDCGKLKYVKFSNTLEKIGSFAFFYCVSLTDLTLPENLTSIERFAFDRCCLIKELTLPKSIKTIGEGAFNYITFDELRYEGSVLDWLNVDGSLEVAKNIYFASDIPTKDLVIPEEAKKVSGFAGLKGINSVTILNGATEIGDFSFSRCSNLVDAKIAGSVKIIGEYAFSSCIGLKNIELSNGISTIKGYVFRGCTNLNNINIPESVTLLDEYTFENCSKLDSVTISSKRVRLGRAVFFNCKNLNKIVFNGTIEEWNSLNKNSKWNDGSNISIIECNDGNINL